MKSAAEEEQEELKALLAEAAQTRKKLEQQEEHKQGEAAISKVFKGVCTLLCLAVMLVLVVKKIANIQSFNLTGWIALGVAFVVVTLVSVTLSGLLEKKTNLSENASMNISVFIVFSGALGTAYLFWDGLSKFFS